MVTQDARPLALTMGEPAGIGGELVLKAWQALHQSASSSAFCVIDDPARLAALAKALSLEVPIIEITSPERTAAEFGHALPVLPEPLVVDAVPGAPDPRNAPAVLASIDRAAELAWSGKVAAMVTAPVHKGSLIRAGFEHSGHTEYLAELAARFGAGPMRPVMMLACPTLRVVPVTVHVALADALAQLSTEMIVETCQITAAALRSDFGLERPRLAISGINPHAGEGGTLGREELDIIEPAIERLRGEGIDARGPVPADSLFHPAALDTYDAAVCMTHDQALIPIKAIAFESAVNVTLGLPFVRTSPDHGTALDIAGRGKADPRSTIAAIEMAARLAAVRRAVA